MGFGEFLEQATIVPLITPVDLSTAANNGDWFDMANYNRAVIVLYKGIGTAGQDPIVKLQQAKTNAGTPKDLLFTRIREKVGATALTAVSDFDLETQAGATSFTDAESAENEAMIVVEIKAADLDVQNGYHWVQLSVADVGANAQLGCGFAILTEPRFAQATPPTAIV
jgi:hypothetical protein